MVRTYVEYTNDTSILSRAVQTLIKEHNWWTQNRTVNVTAADRKTYTLNRYVIARSTDRMKGMRRPC